MPGVIIYQSKYGSTKEYASWLQAETGFDLYDVAHCPHDLTRYDLVVLGSRVVAGRFALAGWVRSHWPALRDKTVLLLLTNITADADKRAEIVPRSLPSAMAERLRVFPVGGRYQLARMSWFDRTMITMVASLEKRPAVKAELLTERDDVRKENLQEILAAIREAQGRG
ncbi:MAG TPA: flavodoxin domain-containing protein [Armatimonadota bacterium]|jgi:menaquinone-dependent protoporphyrinogen IX oxidase